MPTLDEVQQVVHSFKNDLARHRDHFILSNQDQEAILSCLNAHALV